MQTSPRRALVVIDVQNEYFTGNLPIEYPPTHVSLPNIVRAMDTAREAGIPVIVVQHETPAGAPVFAKYSKGWELHAQVSDRLADYRIYKTQASVFAGTDFAVLLSSLEIDTLSIVGYMTHNCNAATAFDAAQTGYHVEHLSDAAGALAYRNAGGSINAEEAHRVLNTVLDANFAAVMTTSEWISLVQHGLQSERDNIFSSNLRTWSAQ